ncbi:MAG: hypothetical protein EOM59_09985 [Clostridia bacterium]|nr:hypothetical protein [Clostridia bacterium]
MNKIIIDWLSFTIRFNGVTPSKIFEQVLSILELKDIKWELLKGMYGYRDRYYFNGISVHVNNTEFDSAWIEMSGQGCRAFEDFAKTNWDDLISLIVSDIDITVNRLDIAYDDMEGILDINEICQHTMQENFTSRWRKYEVIISNGGNSVIHGSRKSDMLLRIYDKAAEQKLTEGQHWIRAEMQMRSDNAAGFLRALYLKEFDLGYMFSGCLLNYLRYYLPGNDSHENRLKTAEFWDRFIGDVEKIRILSTPGVDYTFEDLSHYVIDMAGNAAKTYLEIVGDDEFLKQLKERQYRKNEKYRRLREDAKLLQVISEGPQSKKSLQVYNQ